MNLFYVSRVLIYPIQGWPYRVVISTFLVGRFLNNEFVGSWIILNWKRGSIV